MQKKLLQRIEADGLRGTARKMRIDVANIHRMAYGERQISERVAWELGYRPVVTVEFEKFR